MKNLLKKILEIAMFLMWPTYMKGGNEHGVVIFFKYWFIQKVLRINSHVPWPVHPTSNIVEPINMFRGTRTPGLSAGCHIDCRNGVIIGKNVWIGPRVSIISMNHNVYNYTQYEKEEPIMIDDNCWLGTNCVILPGVKLGKHTIVAAGAVVTKSFTAGNIILGGVPAKIIKKLDDYRD